MFATLQTWAINWALALLLAFAWLVCSAFLDAPSETDALQASADVSDSLAAMYAASQLPKE